MPKTLSGTLKEPSDDSKRGEGQTALFIARNRFAVFDKPGQQVQIRDLSNSPTKSFKTPGQVNDIFYAGTGGLLMSTPTSVILYDIQQRRVSAELPVTLVKYVVWNADMSMVALLSKHCTYASFIYTCELILKKIVIAITIATKNLKQVCQVHETIRIKSGTWDDSGVFIYCTLNHIKYALPQG